MFRFARASAVRLILSLSSSSSLTVQPSLPPFPAVAPPHRFISTSVRRRQRSPPMAAETDVQAAATAVGSGITPESMKATLTDKLQAQFVEIRDESGGFRRHCLFRPSLTAVMCRRLRPGLLRRHRVATVRIEGRAGAAPAGQCRAKGRDRCNTRVDATLHDARRVGSKESDLSAPRGHPETYYT